MWTSVTLAAGTSAAGGCRIMDPASGQTGEPAQAFAGGALLTMLAEELLLESHEVAGVLSGVLESPASPSHFCSGCCDTLRRFSIPHVTGDFAGSARRVKACRTTS